MWDFMSDKLNFNSVHLIVEFTGLIDVQPAFKVYCSIFILQLNNTSYFNYTFPKLAAAEGSR